MTTASTGVRMLRQVAAEGGEVVGAGGEQLAGQPAARDVLLHRGADCVEPIVDGHRRTSRSSR
ncbi:MAG: hypothetical protein U0736_15270 [Gemmataceae bacterium]